MIARRSGFATLVLLATFVGMFGVLAFASAPALAALKTTFLRTSPVAVTENDGFDTAGNIYHAQGGVLEKFNSTDEPAEFSDAGLSSYISGSKLTGTPAGSFGEVTGAAISANGDIYVADTGHDVVDIFEPSGQFLEQWTGSNTPGKSFGRVEQVKVDRANGRVYVLDQEETIDVFEGSGAYLFQITGAEAPQGAFVPAGAGYIAPPEMVVNDVSGNVLVAIQAGGGGPHSFIYLFDSAGKYLTTWTGNNTPQGQFGILRLGVTVDQAIGEVLVGDTKNNTIDVFDGSGDYLTPQLAGVQSPRHVAIDEATGEIYVFVAERETLVFASVDIPDVLPAPPSSLQPSAATLSGEVDPVGVKVNKCDFEYGTEAGVYTNASECTHTAQIGEGDAPVPVTADVSGLQPDTRYHFRLVAGNENGINESQDGTFFTSTAPLIEGGSPSQADSVDATVSAQIDAAGLLTKYRVEYGTTTAYGSFSPESSAGSSESAVDVLARLNGLSSGTEYHFRFVATNALGTVYGPDASFTTTLLAGATSSALPDSRVYELVSQPRESEDWDVYAPTPECGSYAGGEFSCSERPMQAAGDGDALAFVGDPVPGGNGSSGNRYGNEFLSSRGPSGSWTSAVISSPPPPGAGYNVLSSGFWGFSSDLAVGVQGAIPSDPLDAEASLRCTTLYSRSSGDGQVKALFTKTRNPEENCYEPRFVGISADGSHIEFEMKTALTQDAPGDEEADLYESIGGQLNLVNILPDGSPAGEAKFGSASSVYSERAVSADASRLFWTDLNDGNLYVREDSGTPSAKTVLVSEGGEFWSASADGSLVFYTKNGDLYSFDVDTQQTVDLAPGAEVQGVVGTSEDGSHIYYVGHAALKDANGAPLKNSKGSEPVGGGDNLYVLHAGVTLYVATLAGSDEADWLDSMREGTISEAEPESAIRNAEVSPDGQGLVFMSRQSLTGYDNECAGGTESCNEVFVYSAASEGLKCASCSPTDAPIVAKGGFLAAPTGHWHLPRSINEDGTRVFFDSAESLVPQAASGKTQVYEWEQEGSGGCAKPGGCIYLLSSGEQEAFFLDASVSGNDVFFVTRADLVLADKSANAVVYDARVNGYRPVSPSACSGTGCQGVPPAPPIFATPSSVTYEGIGNFSPPSVPAVKPKSKPPLCKKGSVRKHGRCVKRKIKKKSRAGRSRGRSKKGRK